MKLIASVLEKNGIFGGRKTNHIFPPIVKGFSQNKNNDDSVIRSLVSIARSVRMTR